VHDNASLLSMFGVGCGYHNSEKNLIPAPNFTLEQKI